MIEKQLKTELTRWTRLCNIVLTSSCRNALYLVLCNLNLKEGDEVIIQSFICASLPLAIEKAGGKVIFVDVDSETYNLNARTVEQQLTAKTKAIIFVHTYGNPSGIAEIQKLCRMNKIMLIEDIAHAFGARYNGQLAGTFGDYAVYSFTKQMINVGGGAILTNHPVDQIVHLQKTSRREFSPLDYAKRLIASLYETRAFFLSKMIIDIVRKNKKLQLTQSLSPHHSCSGMEAFLALQQLRSLPKQIARRKKNYLFLQKSGLRMQKITSLSQSSHNYLSFSFPDKQSRDRALQKNFLFLPPWDGSRCSDTLIFIPNNPFFRERRLRQFVTATFIKKRNSL